MIAMNFATFRRPRLAAALAVLTSLAWLTGCPPKETKKRGDRSVRPLDNMERAAARNVSIETAIDAIEQRDVKRLKMLDVYVRNRSETALISPDELSSLGLAIDCLENKLSREERSAVLDKIKSGKLKAPATEVCLEEDE